MIFSRVVSRRRPGSRRHPRGLDLPRSRRRSEALPLGPPDRIDDESFWERVRGQFHLNPDTIYLNNGTLGLCPKPVTQAVFDGYTYLAETGSEGRFQLWDEVEESRKMAARFLGADEKEIALTRNATEGLRFIVNGIRMEPGDEMLMTTDEHIAGYEPWTRRARRYGIRINQVHIPSPPGDKQEVVDLFEQALTPRTKAVFFCHVTRGPGLLYPVRELCDMAREKGIVSAVDGAQTPGMTPVNLRRNGMRPLRHEPAQMGADALWNRMSIRPGGIQRQLLARFGRERTVE